MRLGSLIQKLPSKIPQRLWRKISADEFDAVQSATAAQADAVPGAVLDEADAAPEALLGEADAAPRALLDEADATPGAVLDEVDAMPVAVPHEDTGGVGSDLLTATEGVERQGADEVINSEGDAAEDEGDEDAGGLISNIFAGLEEIEEETGLSLLIASLPDCPTQELLEDAKRVEALMRQRKRH